MDQSMMIVIGCIAALGLAGFLLPFVFGDSYYFKKWRYVSVFCVIMIIWILLTPNGCHFG